MKAEQCIAGGIFWAISPTIESENYGDNKTCCPWCGKLFVCKRAGGVVYELSQIKVDGDADRDANATAIVFPDSLFETYEEAKDAFVIAKLNYYENLLEEVNLEISDLRVFLKKED